MSDAFTAVVVCVAAMGATPDLRQCPHALLLDDGGYSSTGQGYSLAVCNQRLRHMRLTGDTLKFCTPSPMRKGQIDGIQRQITEPDQR